MKYWDCWAKTHADGRWHALPFHLLDVAATAEALWKRLPETARRVAIAAFGDGETAERTVVYLSAVHDIGKANKHFQAKASSQRERLGIAGAQLPSSNISEPKRHGQATGAYLMPWLMERWGWRRLEAACVSRGVGGHHGTFFPDTSASTLGIHVAPWSEMGIFLLDDLAATLQVGSPPKPCPLNPFLGWLSGFVSVADWLGSHDDMCVWQTAEVSFTEYLEEARIRAVDLLDRLQWYSPNPSPFLPLAAMLPAGAKPNPLQSLAATVAQDFTLAIVEAPTGEGKTEASFALSEPGRSTGGGLFFALPTMATANGLHGRVAHYLGGEVEGQTRLLHSQSWLFRDALHSVPNPDREGATQERRAQDWFAGAKRGLLAPYAVGTIDQALIGALRAKHGFVRLFALAGKTVVIDEVHAYDVYMGDVMGVLLGWLRALGCKVVLLSATLPKARREALMRAWGCNDLGVSGNYPCITWVASDGSANSRDFNVGARKPVTIHPIETEGESWRTGARRTLDRVKLGGGMGALILNTVGEAQAAYDWLREQKPDAIDVELFHARFTISDRNAIEGRVLERYGKAGARQKPSILVATQVVEQSLDLDFDHMVSALAPVDLLIQRAGRLHRHRRDNRGKLLGGDSADERPNPAMEVLVWASVDAMPPEIEDFVYLHNVLLRTLQWLGTGQCIVAPAEVSAAIESVYGEGAREEALAEWAERLQALDEESELKQARQRREAERATIGAVDDEDTLIVECSLNLDEYDERHSSQLAARTRLQDRPSITVVLLDGEADSETTIHGGNGANARDATFASVNISPPYALWHALLELETLDAWEKIGSLSRARPLYLREGRTCVGNFELVYNSATGLEWRKADA